MSDNVLHAIECDCQECLDKWEKVEREKMNDIQPNFALGKKLGVAECVYGNIPDILNVIGRLLYCMKETNKLHNVQCEFFRIDFRPQCMDEQLTREFPMGALVLDMKWGSRKEFSDKEPT